MASSPLFTAKSCFVPKPKEEEEEIERTYAKNREIILTLPKENGWSSSDIRQYHGCWFHPVTALPGIMYAQQHFKARSEDVLVATHPKCGTTWLKALVFCVMNRTKYNNKNSDKVADHEHPLHTTSRHEIVPFLELTLFRTTPIGDPEVLPSPRLLSTHMPFNVLPESVPTSGCKIVYICRNPKDVFVSMYFFLSKLRKLEGLPPFALDEAFDLFCKGASHFGPFWDHVLGYWKASLEMPGRILFLRYEDLKANPFENIKKLAGFLGCDFSLQEEENGAVQEIAELCNFENMRNMEVNKRGFHRNGMKNDVFFREGKVGDWKNHLTSQMVQRLDEIIKQKLDGFGFQC